MTRQTVTHYRVAVFHDGAWLDMPGFAGEDQEVVDHAARHLAELGRQVRLTKVRVTTTIETVQEYGAS